MLDPAVVVDAAECVRGGGSGKNEVALTDDRARREQIVRRFARRQVPVDRAVLRMDRKGADRAAGQPVQAVPAGHVLEVIPEVIEELLRETPGRFLTNFADRGRWFLI